MGPDEVVKFLRKQPFEPFSMRLHDGRTFEGHHPELVLVTKRSVFVAWYKNGQGNAADESVVISPIAIATLHPLTPT